MSNKRVESFLWFLAIKIWYAILGAFLCILEYITDVVVCSMIFGIIKHINIQYSVYYLNSSMLDIFRCGLLNYNIENFDFGSAFDLIGNAAKKYQERKHQRYSHPKEFLEYMKERVDNPGDPNEWIKSLNEYIASEE